MAKQNNEKFIVAIILIALAIYFIGPQLGLFSINLFSTPELLSDFIGKGGTTSAITTDGFNVDTINQVIDKAYVFGIFDTPVKITPEAKQNLVDYMQRANTEWTARLNAYGYSSNYIIFTPRLIETIQKESYTQNDFDNILSDFGKVPKAFCNSILLTNPSSSDEYAQVLNYCKNLPESIFIKDGSKWKIAQLQDLTIIEGPRITYTTENLGECKKTNISCPNGYTCNLGSLPTINEEARGYCQRTIQSSSGQNTTFTVKLSHLKGEIFFSGTDLFVGLGNYGVSSIEEIMPKYEFAQYAYQIKHEGCTGDIRNGGCSVISNSQNVIAASNGTIKESSQITDLMYGLTKGQGFTDPIVLIAGGAVLLILLILLLRK